MKLDRTWILIADAARARVLLYRGPEHKLKSVEGLTMEADHKRASELGADKPGRSFESVGATRHAVSPHSDPERLEDRRFAIAIMARLDKHASQAEFEHLVVVAPPVMLGELRHALTPHLSTLLTATLDKDLTKIPEAKLAGHLKAVLPLV
ncbi:MAG: host attachment protein [Hyphomicrobiaceae bacterium]